MAVKKAMAKFDERQVIADRVRALNIPANLFGRYCDISSAEINSILNGSRKLTADKAKQLRQVLGALEMVAKVAEPVPVDYRQVEKVSEICIGLVNGTLFRNPFLDFGKFQ